MINLMYRSTSCVFVTILLIAACDSPAEARWTRVSNDFFGNTVKEVAIDPGDSSVIYAGGEGRLFVSKDFGQNWKIAFKLKSAESEISVIEIDEAYPNLIWLGSDEGLYLSTDKGRNWQRVFHRYEAGEDRVEAIGFDYSDGEWILCGTQSGLFVSADGGSSWARDPYFGNEPINQIKRLHNREFLIASSAGLYQGSPQKNQWTRLYGRLRELADEDTGNEQQEIESDHRSQYPYSFHHPDDTPDAIFLIHDGRMIHTENGGKTWNEVMGESIPDELTHHTVPLGPGASKVVIPTSGGVFLHDPEARRLQNISWGLPTNQVYGVDYDPEADVLVAATKRGLYQLKHPETTAFLQVHIDGSHLQAEEVISHFDFEPSIQELQRVAVEYAEVHPDKIKSWRKAASRQGWIPRVNIDYDYGEDEVIELDRGGTQDPDRFIAGPNESDRTWSIDLEWDLSALIWSPSQTSIDNRSKLMVQLRDNLLNELNQLYYTRRRLQIEMMLKPDRDLAEAIDTKLQIEQYTAGIDALTGGYLSHALRRQNETADFGMSRS